MPRASWKGFLRLSLVSCPIYLSPATTRTKSIRLHQVWQPKAGRGAPVEDDEEDEQPSRPAFGCHTWCRRIDFVRVVAGER